MINDKLFYNWQFIIPKDINKETIASEQSIL